MKQAIAAALRKTGLMPMAERVRFEMRRARLRGDNAKFAGEFPGFTLPPDPLLYEISGNVDHRMHRRSGEKWARRFNAHIERNTPAGRLAVLEWGCGVGRVIRHMPAINARIDRAVGCDYDRRMIEWCGSAIPGIEFVRNELMPPTSFAAGSFDAVFCYSVFTHLSLEAHHAWIAELTRIVKPGGLVMFTTMSDACRRNLLPHERAQYDAGELVIRTDEREGSRLFAAFESAAFVRSMLNGHEVVAHEAAPTDVIAQDLWVVRVHA